MLLCKDVIEIKNSVDFIKIKDDYRVFYGGSQQWFKDEKLKKAGCSIVAAANIIAYLSLKTKNEDLYNYKDLSKENFINLMNNISEYLNPNEKIGIISSLYFIEGVKKFAISKGVKLSANWITSEYDYDEIKSFIENSLKKDIPIVILMFRNRKLEEFDWHWMTITKISEYVDKEYLCVSTWGERRSISLEDFYIYSHYGTLLNFNMVNP